METEKAIQGNLKQIGGLTKIIIAHRISAVKNADEILILDDHKIAERGRHAELLAAKGRYYETWCVQCEQQDDAGAKKEVGAWQ